MEHVKSELSAFLDGELTQNETRRIEAHLEGCSDCKAELAELKSLTEKLKSLPDSPLPPGFAHRLKLKRSAPGQTAFLLPLGLRPAAFAATGLLVAFITYKGMQGPLSPERVARRSAEITLDPDGRTLAASDPGADAAPPSAAPAAPAQEPAARRAPARAGAVQKARRALGGSAAADASAFSRPPKNSADYGRGGAPFGAHQAGAARTDYSNEELHAMLEAQKKAEGITFVDQERRAPSALARLYNAQAGLQELSQTPRAIPVAGVRAKALAATKLHSFAPGAPVGESDSFNSWPKASEPESAGILVRSEAERLKTWEAFSLGTFPLVDFSKNMLVVVLDGLREGLDPTILSAGESQGRFVVSYRLASAPSPRSPSWSPGKEEACSPKPDEFCPAPGGPSAAGPSGRYRVIGKTNLPVVFQKVP